MTAPDERFSQSIPLRSAKFAMKQSQDYSEDYVEVEDYVLVVRAPYKDSSLTQAVVSGATSLSQASPGLGCPIITVTSPYQALAKAQADPPHLVILSGENSYAWSPQMARQIRARVPAESIMIVAITESVDFSWLPEEDATAIDGILVEPLSADILSALNESAITKRRCLQKMAW